MEAEKPLKIKEFCLKISNSILDGFGIRCMQREFFFKSIPLERSSVNDDKHIVLLRFPAAQFILISNGEKVFSGTMILCSQKGLKNSHAFLNRDFSLQA